MQRGLLLQNSNHILNERKRKYKEDGGQKPKSSIKQKKTKTNRKQKSKLMR